jgi:hypothetical protein
MKPTMLCLLLLSACSDLSLQRNYRAYELVWRCLSPEGCERTGQVELVDRAEIDNGSDVIEFLSTRDLYFSELAQVIPSDSLPDECSLLYGLSLSARELEPSRFCHTSRGFELELSIPDREPVTHSEWFVEGREIDP